MKTSGQLSNMKRGEVAQIVAITNKDAMRRRLQEVGFRRGTSVTCLTASPLGDPIAYELLGSVIALRREDASQIRIQTEDESWA